MELKKGELVYCKKNSITENFMHVHNFGKYYYIDSITENSKHEYSIIYICCENKTTPYDYYGYIKFDDAFSNYNNLKVFDDYFCTITELRKLKLQKIFYNKLI